jgi:predicted metal-binding protein
MTKKYSTPWEIGSLFICTKCGAKYNQPNLAEEIKGDMRKELKSREEHTKVRVITSGCLGVCYPEEQTFAYMPNDGKTEVCTTALEKNQALAEIKDFVQKKIQS